MVMDSPPNLVTKPMYGMFPIHETSNAGWFIEELYGNQILLSEILL